MTTAELALIGIDTASVLTVWTWGFGSVLTMYFIGYAIGAAKRVIGLL